METRVFILKGWNQKQLQDWFREKKIHHTPFQKDRHGFRYQTRLTYENVSATVIIRFAK